MPDISLCTNSKCDLRKSCYRYMAEPDRYGQAYSIFEPRADGSCEYYWNYINDSKIKRETGESNPG